ncbi:hypothetical protein [Candidatus Electronema sp. PJ]|uniref:hypothetical protein n=1 Tax=Candidatus Electronema sp. PJ TaxID=3401572 RepID=UPI003AA956F7
MYRVAKEFGLAKEEFCRLKLLCKSAKLLSGLATKEFGSAALLCCLVRKECGLAKLLCKSATLLCCQVRKECDQASFQLISAGLFFFSLSVQQYLQQKGYRAIRAVLGYNRHVLVHIAVEFHFPSRKI